MARRDLVGEMAFARALICALLVGSATGFTATGQHRFGVRTQQPLRAASPTLSFGADGAAAGIPTSDTLAGIIGGVDYGGTSAFWDNASPTAGSDLILLVFLTVVFPIAVTVFFFIDRD